MVARLRMNTATASTQTHKNTPATLSIATTIQLVLSALGLADISGPWAVVIVPVVVTAPDEIVKLVATELATVDKDGKHSDCEKLRRTRESGNTVL